MRICFVTAHVATQHHTMMRAVGMAPVLAARGHAVTVIAEDHPDNRMMLDGWDGVACAYVRRGSSRDDIRVKASRIQDGRFDVIHSCGLDPRTYVPRKGRRGAFWIIDHVERLSALHGMPWHKRAFWRWAEHRAPLEADGTIAASRYLEFLFRSRLFERRTSRPLLWLPYAVPQSLVNEITDYQENASLGDHKTILFAGGFYRAYGVYDLVTALGRLMRETTAWRFLFLGKGPERDGLASAVAKAGLADRVTFTGYLPMPEYVRTLALADVLISPMNDTEADWARCPSKLYFYVATGRPIVTAPIGENAEVLGPAGFYYEPGCPESMAAAISQALAADPGTSHRPGAVDPQRHTWEQRCDTYLAWLSQAMA
jgi:glycosyltransferase involved in cell wall biosynthesis